MKKLSLLILCLFAATFSYAGQVELTTYYPSPFGVYDQLRLYPRSTLTDPCNIGTMYSDGSNGNHLRYCKDGTWSSFLSIWDQTGNFIYPADTATNPNLKIGIGTEAPSSPLHINSVIVGGPSLQITATAAGANDNDIENIYNEYISADRNDIIMMHNMTTLNYDSSTRSTTGIFNEWHLTQPAGTIKSISNETWELGNVLTFYGLYNAISPAGTEANNLYGVYNSIATPSTGTSNTKAYGMYTLGATYPGGSKEFFGSSYQSSASSTGGTQYAYHANMTSGTATKWGLYLVGETQDYVSGKLGIGPAAFTPGAELHIHKTLTPTIRLTEGTNTASTWEIRSDDITLTKRDSLSFYGGIDTAKATRMIIDPNGYVGINTSNPRHQLHVNDSGSTGAAIRIQSTGGDTAVEMGDLTAQAPGVYESWRVAWLHGSDKLAMGRWSGADNVFKSQFSIDTDGNVTISHVTTSPTTTALSITHGDLNVVNGCYKIGGIQFQGTCISDQSLKKDIEPLKSSLSKIIRLRPVNFSFKDEKNGPGTQTGLIAQDVEKVFPEWVGQRQDGYKTITYGLQIQMHLIEAVKELKQQFDDKVAEQDKLIKQQQSEIDTLKSKLNRL